MHSRRQIFVKSPYCQQAVALQLDPAQSVLTLSDRTSLLESSQRKSLSDFCVALDGKPLNGSTRIQVSKLPSVSMLTLYPRLRGGGGDGGATGAESRDCYLKMYAEKKPDKVDPNEQRLSKWLNCALSNEPLAEPCVIDLLGNLFNKEALVNALLSKRLPKQFSYIKGLKDMVNIKLTPVAGSDGSSQDTTSAQFQCPVSGLEFNGKYKFFALRGCGHVMSAKALKEVKSSSCLVCHADVKDSGKIVINGTEEEVSLLRERMEEDKAKLREKNDAFKLSTALSQDANRQAIGNGGGDDKDMNFDIEEPDADSTPAIPGLSVSASEAGALPGLGTDRGVTQGKTVTEQVGDGGYGGQGEGDDWDSDSEDDLQIVLNDSSRNVMIGADRRSKMGDNEDDDDDDDDEEPLVIVADTDPNQPMEEQLYGEDGVQTVDGDGKDGGEAGKGSGPGGAVGPPKTGYSSHGYHPFHSQFKYVASDSPVHSSSSDDLAAFLETELESDSDSSSESFPREEAEDDAEVSNHRLKRRKLDHLETVDEIYTEDVASVTFSEEISEASSSKLPCEHPGTFGNMCFVCGQKVEVTGVSFGYIHKGIKLHQDEVSRLRDMDMKGLQSRRKLCLVLDLDHTLLNSTVLRDLKPEEEYLKSQTHSLQDVSGGNLFMLEFMQMMTKLRPFVHSFLKEASEMFVMYIYTMGDRPYARQMAKLLDPKGEYFGERIISRDDGTVRHQKSLDVVLGQEKAVLILDDTENAWPGHKENLIVIERYHFFASSCKQFDQRYQSLSQLKSDESEPDGALATVLKVLKQTHSLFFEDGGEDLSSRDVRSLLKQVRKEILKGCKVAFSRVFPTKSQAEDHPLWKVAEGLGATCATEVDASVTHVVAMDVGTEKVRWAIREKKFVVHRGWIDAAKYLWKKQPEENFGLEQLKKQATEEVER